MSASPIVFTLETISPDVAQAYLETMGLNRRPSPAVVAAYTNAIESDAWQISHQSIAFNEAGELIDGQHRLMAVIKASRPIVSYVARYRSTAPMGVLDTGRVRTAAARLILTGLVNEGHGDAAAIMNAMVTIELPGKHPRLLWHDYEEMIGQDGEHILWALETFPKNAQWGAQLRGAFAYMRPLYPQQIEALAKMIVEKVGYEEGTAAHAFVIELANGALKGGSTGSKRIQVLMRILRLIKAHVENEHGRRFNTTQQQSLDWAYKAREAVGTTYYERQDSALR